MLNGKTLLSALCIGLFVVCSQTVSAQVITDELVESASKDDLTGFMKSASMMDEATLETLFTRIFKGLNKEAASKVKTAVLVASSKAGLTNSKQEAITNACVKAYGKRLLALQDVSIGTGSARATAP